MGLLVEQIIDIVEEELIVQLPASGGAIVGAAAIDGQPVDFVDISYYLSSAFAGAHSQSDDLGKRVVVIDPDGFVRDMLSPVLIAARYNVTVVKSFAEAELAVKQNGLFDALIADADNDQLGAAGAGLFRMEYGAPLPVIGLTASGTFTAETARGPVMVINKFETQSVLNALAAILACETKSFTGDSFFTPEMAA